MGAYTIVVLPEVASLSAYMLMATLGEDAVRLFGEPESASTARVSILLAWAIADVATDSIDVVFNAYSFSETDANTSSWYLGEIERICRDRFLHLNHETRFRDHNEDGTSSLNRIGSELVPRADLFELVTKEPAAFARPENRRNRAFSTSTAGERLRRRILPTESQGGSTPSPGAVTALARARNGPGSSNLPWAESG